MKKLFLFLLFPVSLYAQENYTIDASAGQVTDLTSIVDTHNEKVCWGLNLATGCTQAQACTAASAPGGSSCTATQARGAKVRIFPQTLAGREEYLKFEIAAPVFVERKANVTPHLQEKMCKNWSTFNQTQKDALCTAAGLNAGCKLCN